MSKCSLPPSLPPSSHLLTTLSPSALSPVLPLASFPPSLPPSLTSRDQHRVRRRHFLAGLLHALEEGTEEGGREGGGGGEEGGEGTEGVAEALWGGERK